MIISGFFLINTGLSRPSILKAFSKGIHLWIETLFYSAGIAAIFFSLHEMSLHDFIFGYFFPIRRDVYWFMTDYLPLLLVSPFLSRLGAGLSKKAYMLLLAVLLFFGTVLQLDMFQKGYSLYWFVILFFIGGYLRRFPLFSSRKLPLILLLSSWAILAARLSYTTLAAMEPMYPGYLGNYNGPLTVVMSVSIFSLFGMVKIDAGGKAGRFICGLASLTLGIYLIHEHPLLRPYWPDVIGWLSLPGMPMAVNWPLTSLAVFAACAAVDWLRRQLFRLLKI